MLRCRASTTTAPAQAQRRSRRAAKRMNDQPDSAAIGPLDIKRVMAALPHRYPMLLVDRVESLDPDKGIVAIKAVTINEPFFQGHFPGRPIMPGVLIVEALAQAAGVLAVESARPRRLGQAGLFHGDRRREVPHSRSNPACSSGSKSNSSRSARSVCKFAGRASVDGEARRRGELHGDDRRSARPDPDG